MKAIILAIILAHVASCATQSGIPTMDLSQASAGNTFSQKTGEYIFAPNDIVEIYVHRQPRYSGRYTIQQSGFIMLPIGPIYAKNRSVKLLQSAIQIKLSPYVKYPRVTVSPSHLYSYRVIFSGLVRKPGVYTFSSKTSLLEGIATAGGVVDPKRDVVVVRKNQKGIKSRYGTNYQELLTGSGSSDNFFLERGDLVFVN